MLSNFYFFLPIIRVYAGLRVVVVPKIILSSNEKSIDFDKKKTKKIHAHRVSFPLNRMEITIVTIIINF